MTDPVIETPGVYDLPASVYHSDPVAGGSLSSSGARMLLPPSCPALFRQWADAGERPKAAWDVGHAAHREVLGVGEPLTVVAADDWKTKAAQQQRDEARADGRTPILRSDYEAVQAMAAALRQHPLASVLFQPGSGRPEQSLFWQDPEFGVWRRAMLDWLPHRIDNQSWPVVDYKTTRSAAPGYLRKALFEYGYYQQAPWYCDGVEHLGLADGEAAFVFVFQEKHPPYLVTVVQPTSEAMQWGRVRNRKALDVYATCLETGRWPGYADDVLPLPLPGWADRQLADAWERGDYDVYQLPPLETA